MNSWIFSLTPILILFLLFTSGLKAQENHFEWVEKTGGIGTDIGNDIATDKEDHVIVTGSFTGRVSFGNYVLSSEGDEDMFLMKYNAQKEVLWAKSVGGFYKDYGNSLAVDDQGNIYVTGTFRSVVYFEDFVLSSAGEADIFVAKYDKFGNVKWAKRAGGREHDWGQALALDIQGNVYVTGKFMKKADFGNDTLKSAGEEDLFIAKYDPSGNILWTRSAGGNFDNRGNDIIIDNQNNIYIAGSTRGWMELDGNEVFSEGLNDAFIAKMAPDGKFQWARQGGGEGYDFGFGLANDLGGNVYFTGAFTQRAKFGNTVITSNNNSLDIFTAKYDQNGKLAWIRHGGGGDEDYCGGVYSDNEGNVYSVGEFKGVARFGNYTLSSKGSWDIFIVKYDRNGNIRWVNRAGEKNYDRASGVIGDRENNIYITGHFQVGAAFDKHSVESSGKEDIFVTKLYQQNSTSIASAGQPSLGQTIKPNSKIPEPSTRESEKTEFKSLLIYPNPNEGEFEVSWESEQSIKIKLIVDSPDGTILYSHRETLKKGHNSFPIKIPNPRSGLYRVRLSGKGKEIVGMVTIR